MLRIILFSFLLIFISHSCSQKEDLVIKSAFETRVHFKEDFRNFLNIISNKSFQIKGDYDEFATKFLRSEFDYIDFKTTNLTEIPEKNGRKYLNDNVKIFDVLPDELVKEYIVSLFDNLNNYDVLVDVQTNILNDSNLEEEAAFFLIAVSEPLLLVNEKEMQETSNKSENDQGRIGSSCPEQNECNSDCIKDYNDEMEIKAAEFASAVLVGAAGGLGGALIGAAVGGGWYYFGYTSLATKKENCFFDCDQKHPCQ